MDKEKFLKEIENLTIAQIDERLLQMETEVRDAKTIEEVDELKEKKELLIERKEELEELEERKKGVKDLTGGANAKKKERGGKSMPEKRYEVDSKEYREAYMKSLMGKELTVEERAALTEAAAVIPTETLNTIVSRFDEYPVLKRITILNIPGYVEIPREDTVNDANWVEMGAAATDSDDSLTAIQLAAYKLIKTIEIGADVAAMSIPAFETWLVDRLVNKMGAALSAAVFTGTGSNQPTGIATGSEIVAEQKKTYTKASLDYKTLVGFMAAVPAAYHKKATWAIPAATFFEEILGMVDANKKPIVVADVAAGGSYRLMGREVDLVDDADGIYFGDFSRYYMNIGNDIEIKSDGSVAFRTGSTVYRAMALVDGKLADNKAIGSLKTA